MKGFDINIFADEHTTLFTIFCIIIVLIVIGILFGVYRLASSVIKQGGQLGPMSVNSANQEEKKIDDTKITIDNKLLNCLSTIVDAAVCSGFDRSVKRQELYNKQMEFTKSRFESVINNIVISFCEETNNYSCSKLLFTIISQVIKEAIYIPLGKVYKADRLIEKSKEAVLDINREVIKSLGNKIINLTNELVGGTRLNQDNKLLNLLKKKNEDFEKAATDSLSKAYDFAFEEMQQLNIILTELNEKIKRNLYTYLGETVNELNLPKQWNDDLPPNSIIGVVE